MSEQSVEVFTLAEFLDWEEGQPVRHELVGGRAYAMAGGTRRSNMLKDQFREVMGPLVRARGCRPYGSDMKLVVPSGTSYYPDFMACCGRPPTDERYEDDAVMVVEVLSPSTRAVDRREKLQGYATLRSIEAYVLAEPDIRHFQVVRWAERRPEWEDLGPGEVLITPFGPVSLDSLYDLVDVASSGWMDV